jgi:hypothetical protein
VFIVRFPLVAHRSFPRAPHVLATLATIDCISMSAEAFADVSRFGAGADIRGRSEGIPSSTYLGCALSDSMPSLGGNFEQKTARNSCGPGHES